MDHEDITHGPYEDAATPDQNPIYQRSMRSLNMLATRFVTLLQAAKDGELNLKEAVRVLAVGQKRRIYDITNVLEGVGLIVKMSKSIVKWKGVLPGENAHELANRLMELKSELEDLEQKECMLDQQKFWVEQSIRNTTEDCSNLTYVSHEDICNCFSGHTLLAVQAPSGTQLDVPIPKAVPNRPPKYQIYLKSMNGPIDVTLLNKHSAGSVPVVWPVPPTEEILRSAKSAMSTSETDSSVSPCQTSANTNHSTSSGGKSTENTQHLQSPSSVNENMNSDLTSEVLSPTLRLSPPPTEEEYVYNLGDGEGLCDLFDIPVHNALP